MNFLIKLMKNGNIAEYVFVKANTPNQAIDYAISNKLISNGQLVAEEISFHNATIHTNTQNVMVSVFNNTYIQVFK